MKTINVKRIDVTLHPDRARVLARPSRTKAGALPAHDQRTLRNAGPWEFIQLGNCGSPIEAETGWLVITHGAGPMRKYCIGAFLLDCDDPTKVTGRLREPLITPNKTNAKDTFPTSSTPVAVSCTAAN